MKPALAERSVLSSGGGETYAFGMSDDPDDLAQLFWVLRDALYTNKILAVLREYSSNAWDAHREVGKLDVPIKVVLPTQLDPAVVIRDYGPGLSHEFMTTKFVKAGRSTKRGSDKVVGMLGIGRLSGFAYNDSFTVTSWHDGMKRMYHAVIDESNIGYIMPMHEEPCAEDETGIEVKIPVIASDIYRFQNEANRLFCYFRPLPHINIGLTEPDFDWKTEHGFLRKNQGYGRQPNQWQAIMGCVPYRLDLDQIWDLLQAEELDKIATALSGGLYFDIGDVMISANREDLQYTDRTKTAIVAKFKQVIQELVQEVAAIIEDEDTSFWERRMKLREFVSATGMPLTKAQREAGWGLQSDVVLYRAKTALEKADAYDEEADESESEDEEGLPLSFRLKKPARTGGYRSTKVHNYLKEDPRVPVHKNVRLLIKDTIKSYRGYVTSNDLVVTIREGHSVEQVEAELDKFLDETKLRGVPVVRMSTMEYQDYATRTGTHVDKAMEQKHLKRCFVLTKAVTNGAFSKNWEIRDREEDEDDVFVILHRFYPVGHFEPTGAPKGATRYPGINGENFYKKYVDHKKLLKELFEEEMPTIWGLKTTAEKPVDRDKVVGTPYEVWIYNVLHEAVGRNPEIQADLEAMWWYDLKIANYPGWDERKEEQAMLDWLKQHLDGRHTLPRFLRDRIEASKRWAALPSKRQESIRALSHIVRPEGGKSTAKHRLDILVERYPLLAYNDEINQWGLAALHRSGRDEWLRYINLIDTCPGK
jgi:hypothetical protein